MRRADKREARIRRNHTLRHSPLPKFDIGCRIPQTSDYALRANPTYGQIKRP
jgi:hypothetical protein